MKLIVHELYSSLSQNLTPKKNIEVKVIRPHILIFNKPVGTLKVQVCSDDDTVLAESNEVDIQDITTLPHFHGYVRFDLSVYLQKNVSYKVKIVTGGGYSFSESGYCGVCNDYDLRKYPTLTEVPSPLLSPLDLEVWSLSSK